MTVYFEPIFQRLVQTAYRNDAEDGGVNLSLAAFTALGSLCENSCVDSHPVLYSMLIPILQALETAINSTELDAHKSVDYQDYLCGIL
jgi:hypothetical protein